MPTTWSAPAASPSVGSPSHTEAARWCDTDTLLSRWREHRDLAARDELVTRFLPFTRNLAARYRSSPESLDDLEQVASLGLLGAIDRFNPAHGIPFRTFAVPTIVGELKHHYRNTGWAVHVPPEAQELALRVQRATRDLAAYSGHPVSIAALAERLELTADEVRDGIVTAAAHYSVSLDVPGFARDTDEAGTLVDSLGTEDDNYELVETVLAVSAAMTQLPDLERRALTLRLSRAMTETEIGHELHCSQMHVSRLLHRGMIGLKRLIDVPLSDRDLSGAGRGSTQRRAKRPRRATPSPTTLAARARRRARSQLS